MMTPSQMRQNVRLAPYSTLKVGGNADFCAICPSVESIVEFCNYCFDAKIDWTILGFGSNTLISDQGVRGAVIINRCSKIERKGQDRLIVDCGAWLQNVFLKSIQWGLSGLEFAVGIPGSVGGALVSNAGAYRASIGELIERIEIFSNGERKWVGKEWLELGYRDSRLRRAGFRLNGEILLRVELKLSHGNRSESYRKSTEFQRQRISKQPPSASAGSFFKNVENHDFASSLPFLPDRFKEAGIVPAGFLIEAVGLKGYQLGRAAFGTKHANFIVNLAETRASVIYELAKIAKLKVFESFGQDLEEEVIYFGDWSARDL